MISMKTADFGYDETLFRVDQLELNAGTATVLIGGNGTGKSTLLKTLIGQVPLRKGDLTLDGKSHSGFHRDERARLMAFVPVRFPIMEYVRVREFIALGSYEEGSWFGTVNNELADKVVVITRRLGIEHLIDSFTSSISDGERQLVAIAQAICTEAPIVLLDEPTAFLDYGNKQRVLELIQQLANEHNKCVLFSSHDLDICVRYFDRYLIVQRDEQKLTFLQTHSCDELIQLSYP